MSLSSEIPENVIEQIDGINRKRISDPHLVAQLAFDQIILPYGCDILPRHSLGVARNASVIIRNYALLQNKPQAEAHCMAREVHSIGIVHDIGKVCYDFFKCKGKLPKHLINLIPNHVIFTGIIMGLLNFPRHWIIGAEEHHECEDGSGYPNQKPDQEISLYGAVLHIGDILDASCDEGRIGFQEVLTYTQGRKNILDLMGRGVCRADLRTAFEQSFPVTQEHYVGLEVCAGA